MPPVRAARSVLRAVRAGGGIARTGRYQLSLFPYNRCLGMRFFTRRPKKLRVPFVHLYKLHLYYNYYLQHKNKYLYYFHLENYSNKLQYTYITGLACAAC